jgi:hypothetical protein
MLSGKKLEGAACEIGSRSFKRYEQTVARQHTFFSCFVGERESTYLHALVLLLKNDIQSTNRFLGLQLAQRLKTTHVLYPFHENAARLLNLQMSLSIDIQADVLLSSSQHLQPRFHGQQVSQLVLTQLLHLQHLPLQRISMWTERIHHFQ